MPDHATSSAAPTSHLAPSTSTPTVNSAAAKCHVLRDTSLSSSRATPLEQPHSIPFSPDLKCHVLRDTLLEARSAVIELRVRNHPGTMSHITGLFARRGFNLDAIVCVPIDDGASSRIRLLVSDDSRLEQLERQLTKLHDVFELRHRSDLDAAYFARVAAD